MARLPAPGLRVRWIFSIAVLVALLGAGYVVYDRQKSEQQELLASIAQSDKTIAAFRAVDLSALEKEVASLKDRNQSAGTAASSLASKYRTYTHSIEIGERIYEAAEDADVTVTSLSQSGPTNEAVGTLKLESYVADVNAEAAVPPQLLNFLQKVSASFETSLIESVSLDIPRPPEEGTTDEVSILQFQVRVFYVPEGAA